MLTAILIILVVLWFFGYLAIPGLIIPNIPLFILNGQMISLWNLLIFLIILSLVSILPSPFRIIVGIMFILWILSTLGILVIAGLSSILVIAIVVGAILSLLGTVD